MTSQSMRDQVEDYLITPKNSALIIIDFDDLSISVICLFPERKFKLE